MKILLDTHIWLWYSLQPERISSKLLEAIQDINNDLWLSPISIWETLLLAEKNRLSFNKDSVQWIRETS